ncbi:serine/threonine protein kinase [Recurvomyces mirabilis]|uniref:non-specific serine/threonine protein kinase n=1 Tax=Recurvomyces mirabilis TaxID=574656 RepID=A0AAE0WMX9_9PEZI|nr:serine/threonine protein kinase [Recurvomyces mirabilis]KAK5152670.1 serine/threonine protein kinase [Recurvomyces mirabilis]
MREKIGWAASSPRIASAQARLNGDEELLSMMELLQKANMMGNGTLDSHIMDAGHGLGLGPLTGPAHMAMANENVFERSFMPISEDQSESPTNMEGPETPRPAQSRETEEVEKRRVSPMELTPQNSLSQVPIKSSEHDSLSLSRMTTNDDIPGLASQRPHKSSLKRTYTDVAGYSLQHRLTEALAQPYRSSGNSSAITPTRAPTLPAQGQPRSSTVIERAPHGHRNAQAQAIFTTEAQSPWTITAANDLACLVFGVTRAEVRKLGIMEVIKPERRKWLEDKLRNPQIVPAQQRPKPQPAQKSTSPNSSLTGMRNGVTAKLLAKPPARETYQSRRSKTENGLQIPPTGIGLHHNNNKSRGVLLCGDVVPIQKMNGSTGSASLWVKEKSGNLIWVLEEIAEDVAMITVDEIGSIVRGGGDVEAIWGMERLRAGMDVQKLIPTFPKLAGTNTGALDYDAVAELRRFTARTANSIDIPVTIDQLSGQSTFRVSSFPHIAGIMVLHPQTMRVSSSNNVFSAALFGHASPDGMPITDLIPNFDKILNVITDEDKIKLQDGIVIPEHSFRRARSVLALREGSTDAAAIFLRPSGLPARHRDGAEIMIDVQMRVVKSDRDPIYNEHVIEEEERSSYVGSEVVFALWITYSRQMHAVNHGIGHVMPLMSRPGTPPQQPAPDHANGRHVNEAMPSPMVLAENGEDDVRTSLLTAQLEEAKAQESASANPSDGEPFEHPAPDMVKAGCKVIKKKTIDEFNILEEMGQGAYGQVKLARYKKAAAKKMVIKYVTKRRILVDTWHRDRRLGTVPLEIHVLDYLRREGMQHPNIVEMIDFFEDDTNYYIEMLPHGLPGMDLFDYIELRVTMEERECRKIFRQVAEAISHLHINAKVVHRDIKDENVVLDGEGRVKLVDFGSAAYIKSGPFDVFVGTIDYAAPEVLRGHPYRGKEQDVWALGILLYTIVYKENPFYSIDEIMDHDLRVPYVMSEDCIDLIRKMLDRDVERRIGIQGVLEHPWCTVVDEVEVAAGSAIEESAQE